MKRFIPLSIPNFEGNEKKYVTDAVEQGWVSTGGAYITRLEEQLAAFLGVPQTAACQSGTAGIHLALMDAGITADDMVIVPTLTFIAAVNPVKYQFAHPIFMDCDDSLCMDPVKLRQFCEGECEYREEKLIHRASGRQIKAIVVVHIFGNLADMEKIMEVARKYRLKVVEDATEALGSKYTVGKYAGKYAGTLGDYGAFSFNGNKIITTGGGGAVTANSEKAVVHIRYLSTQAKDDEHFYVHNEIGYNYRMTNVQAAIGVAQMEELPEFIRRKQRNYRLYRELFADCEFAELLEFREGTESNQWFYSLKINREKISTPLKILIEKLQERGIQTRAVWGLIHRQTPYQSCLAYRVEKACEYSNCILNLPCSTQITEEEIRCVAESIRTLLGEMANES